MNDKNRLESKLTDNTRQLLDYTSDQKSVSSLYMPTKAMVSPMTGL